MLVGCLLGAGCARPPATAPQAAEQSATTATRHPELADQDHDGIADADDKCVDVPEDHDQYEDEDGCPDRDNDNDGILDAYEWTGTRWTNCDGAIQDGIEVDCRDLPETVDCREDEDGCPELVRRDKRLPIVRLVGFDPETLIASPASVIALDAILAHAAAYPQERYWIEAHIGRGRTPKEAKATSERVAQAIITELVRRGVAAERLTPVAFGNEKPISNKFDEWRDNQRVEVTPRGCVSVPVRLPQGGEKVCPGAAMRSE